MNDADDGTEDFRFETLAVHAGAEPDEVTGAVSPPIYQTSTYAQDGVGLADLLRRTGRGSRSPTPSPVPCSR